MRHRSLVRTVLLTLALAWAVSAAADPSTDHVFVVTSDYEVSGQTSTVGAIPPWPVDTNLESVHSDAVAREHDGLVYVVNRLFQDNIQVLDPDAGFETVRQFSVGPGSNPQDIAFVSPTRAYVTRYESAWLYEVDPTNGTVTDSIDLSALADADGLPEMAQMAVWDELLFVQIQRLDRDYFWIPVPPSYLAVVDTGTNTLVDVDPVAPGLQGIALTVTNPNTEILQDRETGVMYMGEAGSWGVPDGGIEAIDPVTLATAGFVSTEAQLGGEINDFTLPVSGRAHAVVSVSSPEWETYCISLDWGTGEKLQDVWRPGGYNVTDIEVHPGAEELFLCDRTYTNPGVRVFSTADDHQLTSGPLAVGLPPHDLVVIGESVTSVESDPVRPERIAVAAWPNPFHDEIAVSFALPSQSAVRAAVYGASGRLVRSLGSLTASRGTFVWNGADDAGRRVSRGVYFARLSSEHYEGSRKLLLLR